MKDAVESAIDKVLKDFRLNASKVEVAIDKMGEDDATEAMIIDELLTEEEDEQEDGLAEGFRRSSRFHGRP